MSGVTGNNKIQSRKDFREILKTAKEVISDFPGFKSIQPTGSYNSDKKKTTFGDIDLITHIDGSLYGNDKKKIKSALAKYFTALSDKIIVPFVSDKYAGKRYYNSGEIITISLNVENPSIQAVQVDYMIAMDAAETKFKKDFLDMPAAKQGIVLGAAKVAIIEFGKKKILKDLHIKEPELQKNQEIEFNISSKEIQLRLITYDADKLKEKEYKTIKQEIIWTSRNWENVEKILYKLDLSLSFEKLVKQIKKTFKLARSLRRLQGVFKSMVSIKSGEVGKQKGIDKQKALDTVSKMMLESSEEMKFADFINEMAVNTGTARKGVFSKKKEFDKLNLEDLTLINDRLPKKMSVYQGKYEFFLVSHENEYKGHVTYLNKGGTIHIIDSFSDIKGGFYSIMFASILTTSLEIISDADLTTEALKAYHNLSIKHSPFSIAIVYKGKYIPYDHKTIEENPKYKISIKPRHSFVDVFERYYEKLEIASLYQNALEEDTGLLGHFLYHEGWDDV